MEFVLHSAVLLWGQAAPAQLDGVHPLELAFRDCYSDSFDPTHWVEDDPPFHAHAPVGP